MSDVKCPKCPHLSGGHAYDGCRVPVHSGGKFCPCNESEASILRAAYAASEAALADMTRSRDALAKQANQFEADREYNAELVAERDATITFLRGELAEARADYDDVLRERNEARAEVERLRGAQKRYTDPFIQGIRDEAQKHGYAIGVHGSLCRDLDLIAVPWKERVSSAAVLVDSICALVNGFIINDDNADANDYRKRNPEPKPRGRLAWSIHLGGGPYIDLSVIVPPDAAVERARNEELKAALREIREDAMLDMNYGLCATIDAVLDRIASGSFATTEEVRDGE